MPEWFATWLKSLDEAQKADLSAWLDETSTAIDEIVAILEE